MAWCQFPGAWPWFKATGTGGEQNCSTRFLANKSTDQDAFNGVLVCELLMNSIPIWISLVDYLRKMCTDHVMWWMWIVRAKVFLFHYSVCTWSIAGKSCWLNSPVYLIVFFYLVLGLTQECRPVSPSSMGSIHYYIVPTTTTTEGKAACSNKTFCRAHYLSDYNTDWAFQPIEVFSFQDLRSIVSDVICIELPTALYSLVI